MARKPNVDKEPEVNPSPLEVALKKRRSQRPFPASTFDEPLTFAKAIFQIGSGQPVKRLTLFDQLGKSPESGGSRQLIINAGRYGLTKGGIQADNIELTPEGLKAVDEQVAAREQAKVKIQLAILGIEPFEKLYQKFVGNKLPAHAVLIDAAKDVGIKRLIPLSQVPPYLATALSLTPDFGRRSGLCASCPGAFRSLTFSGVAHA